MAIDLNEFDFTNLPIRFGCLHVSEVARLYKIDQETSLKICNVAQGLYGCAIVTATQGEKVFVVQGTVR